ncbi:hypothetical protein GQ44DRAFT_793376 [Phaeosphaeriaceae sp. PMI808]|nr:hypothetical protein GQ44DRAFT_793376 [Phaeosphaeriaceae sp. PMI808]
MRPRGTDAMSSPRLDFKTWRPDVPKLPNFELPPPSKFSIPVPIDPYQTTQGSSSTGEGTSLTPLSSLLSESGSNSVSFSTPLYSRYGREGTLPFPSKNFENSLPPFPVSAPTIPWSPMSALVPERPETGLATPAITPPFLSIPYQDSYGALLPSYNLSEQPFASSPPRFSYPTPVFSNQLNCQGPTMLMESVPPGLMNFNSVRTANMQHMYNVPSQITQSTGHNDRPFKCDQCPQIFNRNHDRKRHKRIHLAVKPFPCGVCDKSFSRKDALKVCCPSAISVFATLSLTFDVETSSSQEMPQYTKRTGTQTPRKSNR